MCDSHRFTAKWKGETASFDFSMSATVESLRAHVQGVFSLSTIKLLGLGKGRQPADDALLNTLNVKLKTPHSLMVIGTKAEAIAQQASAESDFEVALAAERGRERQRDAAAAVLQQQQADARQRREEQRRVDAEQRYVVQL
jgi:hypothetical protein